jgi:putative transposase
MIEDVETNPGGENGLKADFRPAFSAVSALSFVYCFAHMPRANHLCDEGGIFHVTHRCHNQTFLLKFACDRDAYRDKLREHLQEFKIGLLDYCLTSNHVHMLLDAQDRLEISGFMREVAGEFSRFYNQRKGRSNAFWGDNFHATLVEAGDYLWRCLRYIELNMVRCGVVSHPSQWEWVGYHEIMGARQRYRLVDLERLCWRLRFNSVEELRNNLGAALDEAVAGEEMRREALWTESLAVGSRAYVEKIQPLILSRRETDIVEEPSGSWVLKENQGAYGTKLA